MEDLTLEAKIEFLLENQENINEMKPKELKIFTETFYSADYDDQKHYTNQLIEFLEEKTLLEKNCQEFFKSEYMKKVLRDIL